jgi:hypothetical protein
MEFSPLRFLDSDVAWMLSNEVRVSREEEARKFHSNNFENCIDLNREHHYLISHIFEQITVVTLYEFMVYDAHLTAKELIHLYEDEVKNTRLQRCSI